MSSLWRVIVNFFLRVHSLAKLTLHHTKMADVLDLKDGEEFEVDEEGDREYSVYFFYTNKYNEITTGHLIQCRLCSFRSL